jgi:stage II sporulation protein M
MGNKKKQKNSVGKEFKSSIERQYEIAFEYLKESRNFIYFTIAVFFLFVLLGFFVPVPEPFRSQILNYFESLVVRTKDLGIMDLIAFIFSNNATSGFAGLFFGFVFGIFPFFSTILNGFVLGFASNVSVSKDGILSLWRLLPHGIFELPAIFISFGLGIKFSTFIFAKRKWKTFLGFLEKSASVYFFVVLPLLVIAAIIEGTLIFLGI